MSANEALIAQREATRSARRLATMKARKADRARQEALGRSIEAVAVLMETGTVVSAVDGGVVVSTRGAEIEVERLARYEPVEGERVLLLVAGAYYVALGGLPPITDSEEA